MSVYILTVKPLLDLTGIYSWWLWGFFRVLVIWLSVLFFFFFVLLVCKCVTNAKPDTTQALSTDNQKESSSALHSTLGTMVDSVHVHLATRVCSASYSCH